MESHIMAIRFEAFVLIFGIVVLSRGNEMCPEMRCLTKLASAGDRLCSSRSGLLTYINPCADPNAVCDEYSGVCQSFRSATESYPGEACNENTGCIGRCKAGVCMGWSELDYCDTQVTCHVGLRCVEHTCVPLMQAGAQGCKKGEDCANGLMCEQGVCTPMYSLPQGATVRCEAEFAKHKACASGFCSRNACLSELQEHTAAPEVCENDEDCDAEYAGIKLPGKCQCTVSSYQSIKICAPRVTDLQYRDQLSLLKDWTASPEIHSCHRFASMSFGCMRRVWDSAKATRLLELTAERRFEVSFHLLEPCLEAHFLALARRQPLDVNSM